MSVYRRKSGRYAVLIDLEPTADGRRQRKSIGTYRTRKEAESAERKALEARDRGIDLSPKTVTVSELLDRYLNDRQALGRGAKTLQEYRDCADRRIRPYLGGMALAKLRPAHVAEWQAILLAQGGKAKRLADGSLASQTLSAKSVFHAFSLLNGALRFALRMELIFRNPCEAVSRPSLVRSEAKALNESEVAALLRAVRATRWEAFIVLALCTGARRGELCALNWDDVDHARSVLHIRKSLCDVRGKITVKTTKSGKSRSIPLSRMATDALRKLSAIQARERLAVGPAYQNIENALFTDEVGRRITPMAASCAFERFARKAKISTTRLHDLRHTAATTLLVSGIDVRTTAGILGHASPTITLSTYAHLMPEAQRDAVDRLGERIESLCAEGSLN